MEDVCVDDYDQFETSLPPATTSYRPSLLDGLTKSPSHAELLASLPSRKDADRLIERFFESYNPSIPACCKLPLTRTISIPDLCVTKAHE